MNEQLAALLELAHEIGREGRTLALLGEGSVSARVGPGQFLVSSAGSRLGGLSASEVAVCDQKKLLALMDKKLAPDTAVEQGLLDARTDAQAARPCLEAVIHAWLMTLEGVQFIGHCHPVTASQILCSPRARDFAERRMFADEVLACGAASVYVPYADPGLLLAREVRDRTTGFIKDHGFVPRLVVLQNHGIMALGATMRGVVECLLTADKAATIFVGAAAMGGPNFLLPQHVDRIAHRTPHHLL